MKGSNCISILHELVILIVAEIMGLASTQDVMCLFIISAIEGRLQLDSISISLLR